MYSSSIFAAVLGLASTAVASPLRARQAESISVATVRSSLGGFDAQILSANGATFWIGKTTSTSCAIDPPSDCDMFANITTITVENGASTTASMASFVPGGQNIFVAPSGLLSFTEPHLEGVFPTGSYSEGFVMTHVDLTTQFEFYNGSSTGWAVCGSEPPVQLYAKIPAASSACSGTLNDVDIVLTPYSSVGAYEYE
jgi:hypothetical protein